MRVFEGFKFRVKDTPVHKLDPRSKAIMTIVIMILSLIFYEPIPLILILLLNILIIYIGKSLREWLNSMRGVALLIVFIFVLNYIFSISENRLNYSVVMALRFINVVSSFSLFFLTTSPDDFADALLKLRIPYEYVLMFTMALRFVPTLARDLQIIYDAHRSRGLEIDTGNFIERTRKLLPILITLFIFEIKRSLSIAEALESRAFNPRVKRTYFKELRMKSIDWLVVLLMLLLLTVVVVMKISNSIPDFLLVKIPDFF
ncbi:MAG: hypothetical protein DRJ49_03945 [Thermoprotei archaeon]|nr:MAG: hypothetical protein DRJ49_03945 [Thermoprotei archaeon]